MSATFPTPAVGLRFEPKEDVTCVVLGEPVPAKDMFGREMRNVWIRREDTGEEGWFTYGPGAVVFESRGCAHCDGSGRQVQGWTDKNGHPEDQYGACGSCTTGAGTGTGS